MRREEGGVSLGALCESFVLSQARPYLFQIYSVVLDCPEGFGN